MEMEHTVKEVKPPRLLNFQVFMLFLVWTVIAFFVETISIEPINFDGISSLVSATYVTVSFTLIGITSRWVFDNGDNAVGLMTTPNPWFLKLALSLGMAGSFLPIASALWSFSK